MSITAADALMGIFGFKRIEEKAMDKVSETRRALFEAWAETNGVSTAVTPQALRFANGQSRHGGDYIMIESLCSWAAFNAALDAVEIELPETHSTNGGDCVVDYEECRTAIESTSLGLRIK